MEPKRAQSESVELQEERLYQTCLAKLQDYFDGKPAEGGEEILTAVKTANMLAKREQTRGAREAVRFSMAQAVAKSPEELARYIQATQPQIKKLIAAG